MAVAMAAMAMAMAAAAAAAAAAIRLQGEMDTKETAVEQERDFGVTAMIPRRVQAAAAAAAAV